MLFTLKKYIGGMMLPLPLLLIIIALGCPAAVEPAAGRGWSATTHRKQVPNMAGKSESGVHRGAGRWIYLGS